MHIPQPLPDELDLGLLGRIRILNGLATVKEALAKLRQFVGQGVAVGKTNAPLLALATNMSVAEFVTKHTLAPFHFGFAVDCEKPTHAQRTGSYFQVWYVNRWR